MLNSLAWFAARIFRAHRRVCHDRSLQSRTSSCSRSFSAATIWVKCLSLLRHTGMRIGECADLSFDCLRSIARINGPSMYHSANSKPSAWSLLMLLPLPLSNGFDSSDPSIRCLPMVGCWLVQESKVALVVQLRDSLHLVCHTLGSPQASSRTNSDIPMPQKCFAPVVSFPVLMKLLGHKHPDMTMRYADVTLTDLQREFQLARSKPRHLLRNQKHHSTLRTGLDGLVDSLLASQYAMEMFRRTSQTAVCDLARSVSNRLTKIISETRKLLAT